MYGELGRAPLIIQIATFITKYWLRIKSSTFSDTLAGEAARVCMDSNLQPVVFTKYLLQLCDIEVNNFKDFVIPPNEQGNFCHYLKNKLQTFYTEYWKEQIQQGGNNGKLRVYKKLKINFGFEKIHNFKDRQAITKLRISAHKLPVETGRYVNVAYNERLCEHCDLNEIGNEQHFLMSCRNTKLADLRANFMEHICKINNSSTKFSYQDIFMYVIAMQDKTIMSLVAKYCFNVLTCFESL